MSQPNYELLRQAYAILDGIPQQAIDLDHVIKERGSSLKCGTIACGIGWLSMHPKFNSMGLKFEKRKGFIGNGSVDILTYQGQSVDYAEAASKIFGIAEPIAEKMFNGASNRPQHQHKQILLSRIRSYLRKRGQLDSQLALKGNAK
jgi:hypothetical protein